MYRDEAKLILGKIDVINAWAEGKQLQLRVAVREGPFAEWHDYRGTSPDLCSSVYEWRVKPQVAQSRRYLTRVGCVPIVEVLPKAAGFVPPERVESGLGFIAWIDTEWQEHEVPECIK